MRVLIADDVADTGKTLELVRKEISEHVAEARCAVLYHKPCSIITPEYVWAHTERWINFPWSCQDPVVDGRATATPEAGSACRARSSSTPTVVSTTRSRCGGR